MKVIAIFLLLGLSFSAKASLNIDERTEKGIYMQVLVNSDVQDTKLPFGKCKIQGKVFIEVENGMDSSGTRFVLCESTHTAFYTLAGKTPVRIKSDGSFEVLADTTLTYLLFQKEFSGSELKYESIYFENYVFKSQHLIDVSVYLPLRSSMRNVIVDKPVIYAYSEKAIDFILNLKPKGDLLFTYPQLPANHSWKMTTTANGGLKDEKGNEFPYLFWEAKQNLVAADNTNSNELVSKEAFVAYLEQSLDLLGFNAREKTDFITYWGPKMMGHNFVQVQFYLDSDCAVIGDLEITPKPDQIRRVYALFTGMDKMPMDFDTKKLQATEFKRTGFIVLEWGGSVLNTYEL